MSFETEVSDLARQAFQDVKARVNIPAISYGITYQGKVIAADNIGSSDLSKGMVPNTDTIYPIASMTKSFAGTAIIMLRDRGLLQLSDKVIDYIPELKGEPRWKQITVDDLATMNSGLPEDNDWGDRQLGLSDEGFSDIYERGAKGEFVYCQVKGSNSAYSNLSYMMLGRVISRAAKEQSLTFILRNLIEPLGMSSTCWTPNNFPASQYAKTYGPESVEIPIISSVGDGAVFGGLLSSVRDLLTWTNFLIENESPEYDRILSRESRLKLRSRGKILEDMGERGKVGYSYGIVTSYLPKSRSVSFGHSGGLPGSGSRMTFIPERQLVIVALANLTYSPVPDVCERLADEILCLLPPQEFTPQPIVQRRSRELLSLISNWSDTEAKETFATNFFLDREISDVRLRFIKLKEQIGDEKCTLVAEKYLAAYLSLGSTKLINFTLAPAEYGKVQAIKFLTDI